MAKIQRNGLVQIIVTSLVPLSYSLFLNDTAVSEMDVESLSVSVEAPDPSRPEGIYAILSRYVTNVAGQRTLQTTDLFPGTLEVVGVGRRLSITCQNPNSTDGLWVELGLKPDGTGSEVKGLQALRFLITQGILDAKLTWTDGDEEELFPQG